MPSKNTAAGYPERTSHYAHKFCRLLTKAAIAQEIGPEGCWLLTVIAHQEDAKRYRGPVTFWNGQLLPLCGFQSEDRLHRVRSRLVESGWLEYQAGGKGRPGAYWVRIPVAYESVNDTPMDEDSPADAPAFCGDKCGDKEESPRKTRGQVRSKTRGNAGTSADHSTLSPDPGPKGGVRASLQPPTLDEVTALFKSKGYLSDPGAFHDHYMANGWKQSSGRPIVNWHAAAANWERRQGEFGKAHQNGHAHNRLGSGYRYDPVDSQSPDRKL